jgi:predicted RNA-binding Zn-ribbon protein involved in translation (DUF1610 family)
MHEMVNFSQYSNGGMTMNLNMPKVECPKCKSLQEINTVLTAQSNQNVIYDCPHCGFELRNIETSKG